MRLTAFTDYGLRMLMRMAGEPDRAFSTADLAADLGLSRNHLAKIMQRQTAKTLELASFNPAHATKLLDMTDVDWMARIMWASQ